MAVAQLANETPDPPRALTRASPHPHATPAESFSAIREPLRSASTGRSALTTAVALAWPSKVCFVSDLHRSTGHGLALLTRSCSTRWGTSAAFGLVEISKLLQLAEADRFAALCACSCFTS